MNQQELDQHKALLAKMGMRYTEPFGPSDMADEAVQQRMREVAETAVRAPSIFNEQNDFDLGNQVRMLTRRDSGHEGVVCAARDRIFQLSLRVAALEAAVAATEELTPSMIRAGMERLGWWTKPRPAEFEGSGLIADGITDEEAATINAQLETELREVYAAILAGRDLERGGLPLGSTVDLGPAMALLDAEENS